MTLEPIGSLAWPPAAATPLASASDSGDTLAADATPFTNVLAQVFDGAAHALTASDRSEAEFARGSGDLQAMVLDRAQADIAVQLATTAASRATQALTTILGMQV